MHYGAKRSLNHLTITLFIYTLAFIAILCKFCNILAYQESDKYFFHLHVFEYIRVSLSKKYLSPEAAYWWKVVFRSID